VSTFVALSAWMKMAAPAKDIVPISCEFRYSTMWAMGAHSFRLSISIKLTDHDLFVWK
jgi:hypothetical protein